MMMFSRCVFSAHTRLPETMSQSLAITLPQGLPFHYIELATDLCKYAREDLSDWNLSYDLVVRPPLSEKLDRWPDL